MLCTVVVRPANTNNVHVHVDIVHIELSTTIASSQWKLKLLKLYGEEFEYQITDPEKQLSVRDSHKVTAADLA